MSKKTTITDIPRKGSGETDKFGLSAYEKGLEQFLRGAETPITIALQGEWGSGKTSLMNVLHDNLCGEVGKSGDYFSVWINTWEFSLMRDSSEALKQILLKMTKEVISCCTTKNQEVAKSIIRGVVGLGTTVVKSVANNYLNGVGDGIEEALTKNVENNIANLRSGLQTQINDSLKEHPEKKGFIFFIDDLDRIDPPVAVELLELLKNIFTLENCIFVLAIDYDVVIKGLKPKFGELNNNNEREFRSFFDKIIQVPFSMPVAQYQTRDYLFEQLKQIGVISSQDEKNRSLLQNIEKAEKWTIGPNPRSMKRFLNTLSLIQCIDSARVSIGANSNAQEIETDTSISTLLNVSIIGLQVAFPLVYQMLTIEPGFTRWDDTVAAKMNVPRIDQEVIDRLKKFNEFDEVWEQVLYRLCLSDKYLEKNAIGISNLFNMLRDVIIKHKSNYDLASTDDVIDKTNDDYIQDLIQEQLNRASITGFSAGDSVPLEYDRIKLFKFVHYNICEYVRSKFKDITDFGMPRQKTSGQIKPHTPGYSNLNIKQNDIQNRSKIQFQFRISTSIRPLKDIAIFSLINSQIESHQNIKEVESIDNNLFGDFIAKQKRIEGMDCYSMWAEQHVKDGMICYSLSFDVTFDSPDSFEEPDSLRTMQEVVSIFFDIVFRFTKL